MKFQRKFKIAKQQTKSRQISSNYFYNSKRILTHKNRDRYFNDENDQRRSRETRNSN